MMIKIFLVPLRESTKESPFPQTYMSSVMYRCHCQPYLIHLLESYDNSHLLVNAQMSQSFKKIVIT